MRVIIDLDDNLILEAMAATELTTKRAVVEEALRRLIRFKQEERTLSLFGAVDWQGELDDRHR
ncbi:type II toxin-antitoxin system VapB family antitoxin [Azospirillum cavernae]|uniref:Type II toxin-antitoxin system VapB family antitoxin n=1 Tax=Azospirillum cavernae TaxID=2320860 RepID=A0A418VZY4_9PROT|nr:type II toxin-antitoxin system VapB family antitoxin [Azospirillum cavernae]RJF83311.1 type II toxin-antitoxin system VapB family antitoxin [Azospirillum cavernae]